MDPDAFQQDSLPDDDPQLPPKLRATIQRARDRTATPEMVRRLTARALQLNDSHRTPRSAFPAESLRRLLYGVVAIAGSLLLAVAIGNWNSTPDATDDSIQRRGLRSASDSPITKVSLAQAGFQRIEDDLDRADAAVSSATDALQLAAVRYELQQTLDIYHDWRIDSDE